MKNIYQIIIRVSFALFVVLLAFPQAARASHAMGADLTYNCLGGNLYEVSLSFYRDCDGIDEPDNPTVDISSGNCNFSSSITLVRDYFAEISPICSDQIGNSTCNGGNLQGVEEHVYSGIIELPLDCSDYVFSYGLCCRNLAITNSVTPDDFDLYVSTGLDNLNAPCNNSPQFTIPPIPYVCAGQLINYNHGAIDTDGDSLVFSLVNPLDDPTTQVPYVGGFSPTYPISTTPANSFGFDTETGQIFFTPSAAQIGIVTVLVQEYRDGQLIGYTVRDMQVVVINCSNNVPTVVEPTQADVSGGILVDANTFSVCAGNTLTFTLSASDLDITDDLTATSNLANAIPGATLTTNGTNPATFTFEWQTTSNDVGSFPFALTVTDDACPTPGNQILGYEILVPGVNIEAADTTVCPTGTQTIQLEAVPFGGSGMGSYTWSPAAGLSDPNIPDPIATVNGPTSFYVVYNDGVCEVFDTIDLVVDGILTVSPPVTNICGNNSVQLLADFQSTVEPPPPPCGISTNACTGPTNVATVGTGTSATGPATTSGEAGSPYMGYYHDGRIQILYTAADLQAGGVVPGLISSLAFDVSTINSSSPYNNWTIKIGCTEQTELSGAFIFGLDQVYTGAITPSLGWNTYVFDDNVEWNGISSLVVEICYDNTAYTRYDHVFYTTTAYNSVLYTRQDNATGCGMNAVSSTTNRPNIQFTNCESYIDLPIDYTWFPSTGLDNPNIPDPIASPTSNTVYTVLVDNGSCIFSDSVRVNVSPFTLSTTDGNAGCSGNTGSVSVTVNGGNSPFFYNWSNNSNSNTPTGLSPGIYTVTVSDSGGCTQTASATVSSLTSLTVNLTGTDVLCAGDMDGSISTMVNGGNTPYNFQWDNGIPDIANPSNLGAGTYSVTVTGASGCTGTSSVIISEPPALNSTVSVVDIQCFGGADGSITLNVTGGVAPYSFMWDNGLGNTQSPTGVSSGTYTVIITDANGCTNTNTATVAEPANPLGASATGEMLDCNGDMDGTVTLTVSGGSAPYTFLWSNTAITQNITGLGAGTYTVTITDDQGCTTSTSADITEPPSMTLTLTADVVACNGDATGDLSATIAGGQSPYTYQWDNGAGTSPNPTGLPAGTYNLTVTDGGGCTISGSTSITEPNALTAVAVGQMLACVGDVNGEISLTVNGGIPPYTYDWDNNGGNGQNPEGLEAGVYTVLVTDANACTVTASATITEPQNQLSVTTTGDNLACYNDTNGSLTATASGGTAPYNYTWDNGAGNIQNPNGLGANTYSVTVTDAGGCTITGFADITQPQSMGLTTTGDLLDCAGDSDGSVAITTANGTSPYTYSWTGGYTVANPTGLTAGTYAVVVTDANGCSETAQATVSEPAAIGLTAVGETLPCTGDASGSISLTVNGGVPPYSYSWDNGAGNNQNPTGLSSGTYTVIVTDASGCTNTAMADIVDPPVMTASISNVGNVSCNGGNDGSATANAAGGSPPFTYLWSNNLTDQTNIALVAGMHSVTVTDASGCTVVLTTTITEPAELMLNTSITNLSCNLSGDGTASVSITTESSPPYLYEWSNGALTASISNLIAGAYTVSVTDNNGCQKVANVNITEPTAIEVVVTAQAVGCLGISDGSANAAASGGAGGYSYVWDNGQIGSSANFFGTGQHFLTVTDVTGCFEVQDFFIENGIPLAVDDISSTPVSCYDGNDGTATVVTTDGLAPYFYAWSNGQNVQTAVALAAGTYSVTITDSRGCISEPASVAVSQPGSPLALTLSKEDPSCNDGNDGTAVVEVLGGTPGYTYAWSNGSANPNAMGLAAGNYTVAVTDNNGCQITDNITVTEPTAVSAEIDSESSSCNGVENGAVIISNPQGGSAPYFYSLDGVDYGPGPKFIGLSPGGYTAYVQDANGCQFSEPIIVEQPIAVTVDLGENIEITYGDSIQLNPNVNVSTGVTYQWTPATGLSCTDCLNPMAAPVNQTIYTLNVINAGGCPVSDDVTVYVNKIRDIFIPTGFTPNEDGINDVFMIHGGDHVSRINLFRVYDRWGEMIYEARDIQPNDPFTGWDGTYRGNLMNTGTFVYYAEIKFIDDEVFPYKGDVMLNR